MVLSSTMFETMKVILALIRVARELRRKGFLNSEMD